MDQETLDKLGAISGQQSYLYELAKQSICKHNPDEIFIEDVYAFCGTCGKHLSQYDLNYLLDR